MYRLIDVETIFLNNKYYLKINSETKILVTQETIINFKLLNKKSISKEQLEKILAFNQIEIFKAKIISLILPKPRTKYEIKQYLIKENVPKVQISEIIKFLEKNNYINDYNYTDIYINYAIHNTKKSPYKIKVDLAQKGINIELEQIKQYFEQDTIEEQKIDKIVKKTFALNRKKSNIQIQYELKSKLILEGYSEQKVMSIIKKYKVDEKSILMKISKEKLEKEKYKYIQKGFDKNIISQVIQDGENNEFK